MTTASTPPSWKRCSVCKSELGFGSVFYECSVSTCTSGPRHPVFCSVTCWEQHVPVMRHREAWADEKRAPSRAEWQATQAQAHDATAPSSAASGSSTGAPRRIVVGGRPAAPAPQAPAQADDVLVVASKVKAYIRTRSGMNTSDAVMETLSEIVRVHTDRAIEHARREGRRTVMDRDFTDE